jgi:hypothetical protein
MCILNQIHLKIGQEEEKNRKLSNLSRKWKSEMAAFQHEFGSLNTDELT